MTIGTSSAAAELASLAPVGPAPPSLTGDYRMVRLGRAQERMDQRGIDMLLVAAGPSLRYFTAVGWSASKRLVRCCSARGASL